MYLISFLSHFQSHIKQHYRILAFPNVKIQACNIHHLELIPLKLFCCSMLYRSLVKSKNLIFKSGFGTSYVEHFDIITNNLLLLSAVLHFLKDRGHSNNLY
jgi:hypothetical protein